MGGIGNLKGAVLGGLIIGMHPADLRQPDRHGVDAGDRVRLPRADPRVPAAGPARRADEGGRMSAAAARARASSRRAKVGEVQLERDRRRSSRSSLAILLPFFYDSGSGVHRRRDLALAYVVMALGLNIVVGFAGLLDLGYVAFFAIGAYTMGWLGSSFFSDRRHPHRRRRSSSQTSPGIHLNWLLILPIAALLRRARGRAARLPDAAPARRLHRDRDARVRRDHRPHRGQLRRGRLRHRRLQPHQRPRRASRRSTRSTCRSSSSSRR